MSFYPVPCFSRKATLLLMPNVAMIGTTTLKRDQMPYRIHDQETHPGTGKSRPSSANPACSRYSAYPKTKHQLTFVNPNEQGPETTTYLIPPNISRSTPVIHYATPVIRIQAVTITTGVYGITGTSCCAFRI